MVLITLDIFKRWGSRLLLISLSFMLLSLLIPETTYSVDTPLRSGLTLILPSDAIIIIPFGPRFDGERKFHYGADIKFELSEKVFSPVKGQVVFSGFTPAGSGTVTIKTDCGYLITILQLKNIHVNIGDKIDFGFFIGEVDLTGDPSTKTPHIHLSVRDESGYYFDPFPYIEFLRTDAEESQILEKFSPNKATLNTGSLSIKKETEKENYLIDLRRESLEDRKLKKDNYGTATRHVNEPKKDRNVKINSIHLKNVEQKQFLSESSKTFPEIEKLKATIGRSIVERTMKSQESEAPVVFTNRARDTQEIRVECFRNRGKRVWKPKRNNKNRNSITTISYNKFPKIITGKGLDVLTHSTIIHYSKTFLLFILFMIDIIKRQSLLPAKTGGRFRP